MNMPRLKGFRFPHEIIAYAVWAYHRFAMRTADVEDLLAERGVIVSREAIRLWVTQFGLHFANCIRRDRPRPSDKCHLDGVIIPIRGRKHWLWRVIDADHRAHKGLNNAIEGWHRPTRKREKIIGRFKSHRQAQRFLSAYDQINLIFRPRRFQFTAISYRHARVDAFSLWGPTTPTRWRHNLTIADSLRHAENSWAMPIRA